MSKQKSNGQRKDDGMATNLPSAQRLLGMSCHCRGIHGAARLRKGLKHARVTLRRREERELVRNSKDGLNDG